MGASEGAAVEHNFYPRSPCGERRWLRCWQLAARDISIHALLAESDQDKFSIPPAQKISIHALLAESDHIYTHPVGVLITISIHALLAESDFSGTAWVQEFPISIHALLAESDSLFCHCWNSFGISIHALLAESDTQKRHIQKRPKISIHALLAESDAIRICQIIPIIYFYPRSPCGERPF